MLASVGLTTPHYSVGGITSTTRVCQLKSGVSEDFVQVVQYGHLPMCEKLCLQTIVAGIEATEVVPGRTEFIDLRQNFQVLVDSADTPESLSRLLEDVKVSGARKILLVIGCQGERDKAKRPYMGEIAHYKVNI